MDGNLTLDHLSEGSRTLWGRLCGRVELAVPLQPLRGNLTYAALCTITRFEELIKGASSNRARKQTQKQRNKWFCSNLGLMFTSRSSRPLRPPTSTGSVYLSQFLLSVPPPPPAFHVCSDKLNYSLQRNSIECLWSPVDVICRLTDATARPT